MTEVVDRSAVPAGSADDGPTVVVNGRPCDLAGTTASTTTLGWLRDRGLTGAKEGCAEGECGACSVLVSRPDGAGGTRWTAINSCLVPVEALEGQEVWTAEGLGTPEELHPVQEEMARDGGSQCGYCTPGFVCSMAAEYYREDRHAPEPGGEHDHEHGPNGFDLHSLSGNLCRCTGYRPIVEAAYALGEVAPDDALGARRAEPAPRSPGRRTADFLRPADLAEALEALDAHPDAVLLGGSTDWGVELTIRHRRAPFTIALDGLEEMRGLERTPGHIEIGAALSLSEIERGLAGEVPMLARLFPQFASRLIRNGATLGGNLGTGSPIGDSPPALLALDARVVLASTRGEREVPLAAYFTGYRTSVREPGELIRAIRIPLPQLATTRFHKIAKRRFDDISSVAVATAMSIEDGVITGARIGLGGVAATPIRGTEAEAVLVGAPWSIETIAAAADRLKRAGTPMSDHRASADYRGAMLEQALFRFHAEVGPQPRPDLTAQPEVTR